MITRADRRFFLRILLTTILLLIPVLTAGERISERPEKSPGSHLAIDLALMAGANVAAILVIPAVRKGLFSNYSLTRVWDNFKDPIHSMVEGGRQDHNSFWINYVGHPACFAGLGLYLKARGYSNGSAVLITQLQNVAWEYIIEGGLWQPSSKDLAMDLLGAMSAIYILHPLSDLGERRLAAGDHRFGSHLLYWLNPFKEINKIIFGHHRNCGSLTILPNRGGLTLTGFFPL
jgi:hypothetical protein